MEVVLHLDEKKKKKNEKEKKIDRKFIFLET